MFYDRYEREDERLKRLHYEAIQALKLSQEMCNVRTILRTQTNVEEDISQIVNKEFWSLLL